MTNKTNGMVTVNHEYLKWLERTILKLNIEFVITKETSKKITLALLALIEKYEDIYPISPNKESDK